MSDEQLNKTEIRDAIFEKCYNAIVERAIRAVTLYGLNGEDGVLLVMDPSDSTWTDFAHACLSPEQSSILAERGNTDYAVVVAEIDKILDILEPATPGFREDLEEIDVNDPLCYKVFVLAAGGIGVYIVPVDPYLQLAGNGEVN